MSKILRRPLTGNHPAVQDMIKALGLGNLPIMAKNIRFNHNAVVVDDVQIQVDVDQVEALTQIATTYQLQAVPFLDEKDAAWIVEDERRRAEGRKVPKPDPDESRRIDEAFNVVFREFL